MKKLVKKARIITVFIKSHHASQAIFRRLFLSLSIRLPVEIRFATNFIMIDRLLQVCNVLERMIIDDEWPTLMSDLIRRSPTAYAKGASVRRFIRLDGFWDTCENFLYMVILVVKALCVLDGKAPAIGIAWRIIYNLKTHVQGFAEHPFRLGLELAQWALLSFENRWALIMTDLHWARGMLNPILCGWALLHEHDQSRRILNRVSRKLAPNDETYVRVLNQYQDFLKNMGLFEETVDPIVQGAPSHEWWDAIDSEAKALQTIERRIFAQVCSISSYERNWSIYSFVHNKVRNRLQSSRTKDLVYIYTNSRLLRHHKGPNPIQWYGIHQIHSNNESDGEAPDGDHPGGHPDIDVNMADKNNMGNDDYGFDNIDSNDKASDDDSDSRGGGRYREYNADGFEFDGGNNGGGDNFGVFDFCEGDEQPHATMHVPLADDEPRDAPPIQTFSVAEGLQQVSHADSMVVTNPTTNEVEPSQSASDSLDFGDAGKGGNIHQECNPCNVELPEQGNIPSRTTSPNVPLDILMASLPTNLSQSLGLCTVSPLNCPLIRSIANRRGIGATLIMAHGVLRNANHTPMCPQPSSETMPNNTDTATRSFPSSSTVDECD